MFHRYKHFLDSSSSLVQRQYVKLLIVPYNKKMMHHQNKYTNISTWKQKWKKTIECSSYITTRLHSIDLPSPTRRKLQPHRLLAPTKSMHQHPDFLAPTRRSLQPPRFISNY